MATLIVLCALLVAVVVFALKFDSSKSPSREGDVGTIELRSKRMVGSNAAQQTESESSDETKYRVIHQGSLR